MKIIQENFAQAFDVNSTIVNSNKKGKQTHGIPKIVLQSESAYDNPQDSKKSGRESKVCMKGSIFFQKDRGRWAVSWYCQLTKRNYTITRYKGEFMYHHKIAEKCLAMIQSRWEEHQNGLCQFRIEEFTGKGWTDVIQFYEDWMHDVIEPKRKPATVKGYWSYLHNWIEPFFSENPVMLHEIHLDTLNKFLNYIQLTPKGKLNVMMALHSMVDYAWRARRIPEVPAFPKLEEYNIVNPIIEWLPRETQMKVVDAISFPDRWPILWLILHYRRPSEACALFKTDYDPINNAFIIRRTISARELVESTKTRKIHLIPCKDEFIPVARELMNKNPESPFLFVNPRARKEGKRYTNESLNGIWRKACEKVGVNISLYPGTKHTSCTNFIEDGGTPDELQILTDHANRQSVYRYAEITLRRKRDIMERGKVFRFDYYKTTTKE